MLVCHTVVDDGGAGVDEVLAHLLAGAGHDGGPEAVAGDPSGDALPVCAGHLDLVGGGPELRAPELDDGADLLSGVEYEAALSDRGAVCAGAASPYGEGLGADGASPDGDAERSFIDHGGLGGAQRSRSEKGDGSEGERRSHGHEDLPLGVRCRTPGRVRVFREGRVGRVKAYRTPGRSA